MKKSFSFFGILLLGLAFLVKADTGILIPEGKEVMVYSLPKTELCVEIEVEKITETPGVFYRHSERYLAAKEIITEEKTTFRLKNIKVKTNAVADESRTYLIPYTKNSSFNAISVNEKGLLCGINVDCCDKGQKKDRSLDKKVKLEKEEKVSLLPLTEEYMMASSTTKMAEGAAKTIYRIRENRLNLITGDVDDLPADGASLKLMLKSMDDMEKELTELFTGNRKTETQKHTVYVTPTSAMKDDVLFRFSALKGIVSADDLSGVPYYLNVSPETIYVESTGKKAVLKNELYYILPAKTYITIGDGSSTYFSEILYLPQFGQEIPLSNELTQKKGVKISIDTQTGRLLKVEENESK